MKFALAVTEVTHDTQDNLAQIEALAHQSADGGANIVLFAEAALTGLINDNNPAHDLPLGQTVPGPLTARLGLLAKQRQLWLALGLLEREQDRLFDSALLLAPSGQIALTYRRIQPQWHGQHARADIYRQGSNLSAIDTPIGRLLFLICGDLFDDDIVARARQLEPQWVLFPFARCFPDGSWDQERWDQQELPAYAERLARIGGAAFMVNYVAQAELMGGAFGGAWILDPQGQVLAARPLGQPGILFLDTDARADSF